MEFSKMLENMDNFSKKLELIQDYIAYKFGSDFKEFCGLRGQSELWNEVPCKCRYVAMPSQSVANVESRVQAQVQIANPLPNDDQTCSAAIKVEVGELDIEMEDNHEFIYENGDTPEEKEEGENGSDPDYSEPIKPKKSFKHRNSKSLSKPQNLDPNRHAHFGVTYATNKVGNEKMIYQEFPHYIRNTIGSRTYWACNNKTCGAGVMVDSAEEVLKVTKPHNLEVHYEASEECPKRVQKKAKLDAETLELPQVQLVYSEKKKPMVKHEGYYYRFTSHGANKRMWECRRRRDYECAVRMHTTPNLEDLRLLATMGEHNHKPGPNPKTLVDPLATSPTHS